MVAGSVEVIESVEDVEVVSVKDDDEKLEVEEQTQDVIQTQSKKQDIIFESEKTGTKNENFVKLTQRTKPTNKTNFE